MTSPFGSLGIVDASMCGGLLRVFQRVSFPDCALHPHPPLSSTLADGMTSSNWRSVASRVGLKGNFSLVAVRR